MCNMAAILFNPQCFNSLWSNDGIRRHRFESASALVAWQYQAITWTNVDLSSVEFCDIYLTKIYMKHSKYQFTKWKLHLKLPSIL